MGRENFSAKPSRRAPHRPNAGKAFKLHRRQRRKQRILLPALGLPWRAASGVEPPARSELCDAGLAELPLQSKKIRNLRSLCFLLLRTHLINRERVRCWRFGAAARREEEEYPLWIFDRRATPLQRQRSATLTGKALASRWPRCSSVTERRWLCFFVAPRQPPARALRTHSLFMRWVLRVIRVHSSSSVVKSWWRLRPPACDQAQKALEGGP